MSSAARIWAQVFVHTWFIMPKSVTKKAATKKSTNHVATASPSHPNRVFRGGMPTTLGMKIVSATKKKVVAEMPVRPKIGRAHV